MLTLLENATKLQPGNEAIWSKYFKRLISERQWMKAQQVSQYDCGLVLCSLKEQNCYELD